jgi:peptide/nickel transport system permease protein
MGADQEYLLKRLGMFLLTVWLGATLIFFIPRLAPGDPVASMVSRMAAQSGRVENSAEIIAAWREKFGLDAPLHIQYFNYLGNMATFNLGYSLAYFPAEVEHLAARSMPWTLGLLSLATLMSFILGNTVGALLAGAARPTWPGAPTSVLNVYVHPGLHARHFAGLCLCLG